MRIHFLDAMRGVLMALGVVLHSANVYSISTTWEFHDPVGDPTFDLVSAVIHSFRMPAFFMIAGLFAWMTLERRGIRYFVQHRALRLVLPFVAAAMTLNIAQCFLQSYLDSGGEFQRIFGPDGLSAFLRSGVWIQHLWFLSVVLIYCLVAIPVFQLAQKMGGRLGGMRPPSVLVMFAIGLAADVLFRGAASVIAGFYEGPYFFGLVNPVVLFANTPFFLFGLWLGARPDVLSVFCRNTAGTALAAVLCVFLALVSPSSLGISPELWADINHSMLHWFGCHVCFVVFHLTCNTSSRLLRRFADASYTVYLFHHVLVIAGGAMLVSLPIPAFMKFLLLTSGVLIITMGIHQYAIKRIPLLAFLFNGVAKSKTSSEAIGATKGCQPSRLRRRQPQTMGTKQANAAVV